MYRRTLFVAFALLSMGAILPGATPVPWALFPDQDQPQQQQSKQEKQSKAKDSGTSLSGCVDEQNGQYVLIDDATLNRMANLEAVGFPTEGFAKHVGHKVTLRGTSVPGGDVPVFRVRRIETVSDTCAPRASH